MHLAYSQCPGILHITPRLMGSPMSQNPEIAPLPGSNPNVTSCSNCHSAMPSELRFCRNCGFRLGEGLAEYNETVRFQGGHPGLQAPGVPATCKKARRRMSGMTWMFLGLLVFFVAAAAFTAVVAPLRHATNIQFTAPVPPRSYVGVNSFDTTEGGVTFDYVEAPGTPADKAGLVGGDVITTFDGQSINNDDEMMSLLGRTPIGKTVDVVYLRDGETKTTKLTTVSREDYDRLMMVFSSRPEGRGQFGYDDDETERVAIEGTKIFGIKVNSILQSRPA